MLKNSLALLCTTVFMLLLFFTRVCVADEAEDRLKNFQNAVNYMQDEQGCNSIPYSDLQDTCHRKQENEVERWCKKSGQLNCDNIDPKQIQKDIETLKRQRDELKSAKEDLERKKSSLTDDKQKSVVEDDIKKTQDKIEEVERAREPLQRQVEESTKLINDRLYIGKACRDGRQSVQDAFRDAKSRASGETQENVVPLAKRLIAWWDSRYQTHEDQIQGAKTAIDSCDRALYDIGHLGSF